MDISHLDKKIIGELKEKLLKQKGIIEGELSEFADKNKDIKGDWKTKYVNIGSDWDDNAFEVTEYSTNLPIEHTLELRLKNINGALERISKGTYGFCSADGKIIPLERLQANPETTTCLEHSKN